MFPFETKILIVDDLKTIRALIKEALVKNGFKNIVDVDNGKDALAKLRESVRNGDPFGLIISDWNMPDFTGIDLLNAKNEYSEIKDTPFLMVTIESERQYVLKAITLGVDDFIVKPFSEATIVAKLDAIWNRLQKKLPT